MFRGDAEFHEDAAPSHLGGHASSRPAAPTPTTSEAVDARMEPMASEEKLPPTHRESPAAAIPASWAPDAEKELRKIPFFVRGKARRNTERYAQEHNVPVITVETLYDAKAHFGS
jgi:light-independent protochlorophyllide reductase subunit B